MELDPLLEEMLDRVLALFDAQAGEVFLLADDERAYTLAVHRGKAEERPLELGLSNGGWVEVTGGLSDGDQVIVVGQGAVKQGASVRIVGKTRPTATAAAG